MIIVGYQGIGKSTLAGECRFIDLESGNFWVDGERPDNWYKMYVKIAVHLSQQGYEVFTASHKVVRDELKKYIDEIDDCIVVCYPSLELKDEWINKLKQRYEITNLDKDFKAWKNAEQMYEENINDLMNEDKFEHSVITDMDYKLRSKLIRLANKISKREG